MSLLMRPRACSFEPLGEGTLTEADGDGFRRGMRSLASGVSLITYGAGAEPMGIAATSVTSVSAEPPTLLVCINRAASLFARLAPGAVFGVNVLTGDHQEIADRFAGRNGAKGGERFAGASWVVTPDGAPLLVGALAAFECEVEDLFERHTHAIVIGRVRRVGVSASGNALVYWRGSYDQVGWADAEVARAVGETPARTASMTVSFSTRRYKRLEQTHGGVIEPQYRR